MNKQELEQPRMSKYDVEFKYFGFGLYRAIKTEYLYKPEIYRFLTDYQGDTFKRLFLNFWIWRGY